MKRGGFFIRMKITDSDVKRIALGSISDRGARNYQEDSFGFSSVKKADVEKCGFTAVVADGMGGMSGGAKVSAYVVSSLLELIRDSAPDIPRHILLSKALCRINENVVLSGIGGGSTAVSAVCTSKGIYWCTVGDSRIYLFSGGTLTALNEDGDYMNRLMEQVISGDMTFDEAGENKKKDSLAQYIGCKNGISPDGNPKPFVPSLGDKLLLCTDGVYNALSETELSESLSMHADEAAADIRNKVLLKGFKDQDNFTAVVLEFTK